jgi:hypothetical protein
MSLHSSEEHIYVQKTTMCAEQHIQNIIIVYFLIEIKAEIYQFNVGTE